MAYDKNFSLKSFEDQVKKGIRSKSRKVRKSVRKSRKARKSVRKSRKASRKSVRKSRKVSKSLRKSVRKSRRRSSRSKSRRKSIGKRERDCKDLLKEKVGINLKEYKDGRYVSRKQAIAVSYNQVKKMMPSCGKYFKRKNN